MFSIVTSTLSKKDEQTVSINLSYTTLKMLATFVIGVFVGIGFMGFLGDDNAEEKDGSKTVQAAAPSDAGNVGADRLAVSTDDDPFLGKKGAPVTVIEFSDFECPFCSRAYSDAVVGIKRDYIDNGKVTFVYRDFPLSFHPQATPAAEAAECADDQGKFWEYHDKLFENQQQLSASYYKQLASELGLDMSKFNQCVDTRKHRAEVQKDFSDGNTVGVSGTPTFFIGNDERGYIRIVGAQPYSALQQVIEAELAG